MQIDILSIDKVKFVKKPWGYERWIADGTPDFKYSLKEILFRAPHRSSIQFHEYKEETNYILKGKGILYYSVDPIDIKKFTDGLYSDIELRQIINQLQKKELIPGTVFHIKPGYVHRVEAVEDLLLIESSTVELDDVFRLEDDAGRRHGRIENEHLEIMKMNDIYKEQGARYEFASKFVSGKVLDVSHGSSMSYHGAKILLEGGATEVWKHDISRKTHQYTLRKYGTDKSIEFDVIEGKDDIMPDRSFDCIISSETIQHEKNPNLTVKEFRRLLMDDGLLIISTFNSDAGFLVDDESSNQFYTKGFRKDEFLELLKKTFPQVELYSQRLISRKEILEKKTQPFKSLRSKIRRILAELLLRVDKKSNFYKLHLQDTILRIDGSLDKVSDRIHKKNYSPIPNSHEHLPLFFIAVCHKNRN